MNETQTFLAKLRNALGALFILAIVLVVPIFSLVEIGHFFQGGDRRNEKALPALQLRAADSTQLPPSLFNEPLITVTFDDGWETTYNMAMPLLQKYGIRTTQYVLTGNTKDSQYVSWKQIGQMQKAGHEIACHTVNHPDLTSLDDEDLLYQVQSCKTELTKRFGPIYNFAAPYGAQNPRTQAVIGKYFDSQRNTNGDPTNGVSEVDVNEADSFDRSNIIGVTVRSTTTLEDLQKLVAYTKATNGWLVLTYHQADDTTSKFSVDDKKMEAQFKYLSDTNVRIVTMQEALSTQKLQGVEY